MEIQRCYANAFQNAPTCAENPHINMFPLKTMEDEIVDNYVDEVR